MNFSEEWKRILREEVPLLREFHNCVEENFILEVPRTLVDELDRLSGSLMDHSGK